MAGWQALETIKDYDYLIRTMTNTTKSIWDNDLPAGDSPPLPRWPLTAAIVTYTLWMVFMVVMMILRIKQGA